MTKGVIIAIVMTLGILTAVPAPAVAATAANCNPKTSGLLGFPKWYKYLDTSFTGDSCDFVLPKVAGGDQTDWGLITGRVLLAVTEILLRLAGLVAVGFIIVASFRYILSQDEPDKLSKARGTIINALVGLVIAIFAVAIVNFIGKTILNP